MHGSYYMHCSYTLSPTNKADMRHIIGESLNIHMRKPYGNNAQTQCSTFITCYCVALPIHTKPNYTEYMESCLQQLVT